MILSGKLVSDILYEELRNYVNNKDMKLPTIVDLSVGDDLGGKLYAEMKQRKINKETGFNFESKHFNDIDLDELIKFIKKLNDDQNINGIMIQLPLTEKLKNYEREILDTIDVRKDVDGLTTSSIGNLVIGNNSLIPCTPKGIIALLKAYNIDLDGKIVSILNRSNIVGKPLEQLFLRENATPIICHSHTENLKELTLLSDIIVAALNKQEYIKSDYIKEDGIIIDVGVHKNKDNKTVGDVDYNDCLDKASFITPPTGGVGPMTICMLAYNVALAYYGNEINDVLNEGIEKAKVLTKKRD